MRAEKHAAYYFMGLTNGAAHDDRLLLMLLYQYIITRQCEALCVQATELKSIDVVRAVIDCVLSIAFAPDY